LFHEFDSHHLLVGDVEHEPPLPPLPPYYASDAFFAALFVLEGGDDGPVTLHFARLFETKLSIPTHMGSLNTKDAALEATCNVVYFENEHNLTGLGPASLVARVKHMTASKSRSIAPTESLFVLLNTWLVNDLGPKQLAVYTSLISHLTSTNSHREMLVPQPLTAGIFVPMEVKEAKRDLLSGSRSIMMNLARPYTHTLRNGYSYVSCIDSLACLLSSAVKIEPMVGRLSSFLRDTEGNYQLRFNADTPRGAEIQANAEATFRAEAFSPLTEIPMLILLAFLWSDSFEPNATKQNRGSVHAFLLTLKGRRPCC
jgi:hypothetical protein